MRSLRPVSLALLLSACGSKVDLGDAKSNANANGGDGSTGGTYAPGPAGTPGAAAGGSSGGTPMATPPPCASVSTTSGDFNPCGRMFSAAYSPDGQSLATATADPEVTVGLAPVRPNIHLWNMSDGSLQRELDGIPLGTYAVAFSPDGRHLAAVGQSDAPIGSLGADMVKIYDARTGAEESVLQADAGAFTDAVAFSNDGALLATGGYKGHVQVWRVADGSVLTSVPVGLTARNLHFAPVESQLLVTANDGTVAVWNIPDGTQAYSLPGFWNEGDAVFSPDGAEIAYSGLDDSVRIWDVATGTVQQTLTGHPDGVGHLLWVNPDRILSYDWHGMAKSWTRDGSGAFAESQSWTTVDSPEMGVEAQAFAVSPDGTQLALGTGRSNATGFEFLSL